MKWLLDMIFGSRSTLKRETVIVCWGLMILIVVRVYVYIPPEHIRGYEYLISGIFWPVVILLGAIFGFQLAPMMSRQQAQETVTRVETPGQTVETTTKQTPAPTPPPADPAVRD